MDNWHKIDLHQHTINEVTSDGKQPQSLYTHKKFEALLKEEKVSLKAVTNHNTLNLCDHIKHALICKKNNVEYLPGVEIDYVFNGNSMHAISILNPQMDIIPYSKKLSDIVYKKKDNVFLDKDEFATVHENIEFIFIPHVMKSKGIYPSKNKPVIKEGEDWVFNMIRNGSFVPVIFENTRNYNKYSIYGKIDEIIGDKEEYPPCYVGSDFKFDNDERRRRTAIERLKYYIDALPTYRGLEIAVRNHETRIAHESELINRSNYLKSVSFSENVNFNSNIQLDFSPSLNVIIGGSGSGKTLLLNELFRAFTGENLKSVKTSKSQVNKSAYYSKVGKEKLFDLITEPRDSSGFKVIEIPNIYTEIMKYINDTGQLAEVFGISNRSFVQEIIDGFKTNCKNYSNYLEDINDARTAGEENLRNIATSIDFLNKNKASETIYNLKTKISVELESAKTRLIIDKNDNLANKKDSFIKYFHALDVALDSNYSEMIKEIIEKYLFLISKLAEKNDNLVKIELEQLIIEQIETIINTAIRTSNSKLGLKEKAIKEREETKSTNEKELIGNIKKCLIAKSKIENCVLEYPYHEIKHMIEEKNSNELARFSLASNEDELKCISPDNADVFETQNVKTKLKALSQKTINLYDDDSVKEFIRSLKNEGISIDSLIKNDPNLILELKVDGEWKPATNVNQGTIAKVSMEYYFNSLINNERPDIIFIDQPENDVDKEFLTTTLAKFLIDKKTTSQIFITSHDAILTVNADANMIIQADIDENNKIGYISYPLEYSETNNNKTDEVARILDGGKRNIEKRYQIYGGL